MYTGVTPLRQELLKTLNRLLVSSPAIMWDLIVNTVPVRLTHLLRYLMKPLVYALRAGPELVTQGFRTLKLCVDNLTPEFLDPTPSRHVLRDLMSALHDVLRPLPRPHVAARATVRILGGLGGRDRRLRREPLHLAYRSGGDELQILLSFDGRTEAIDIGPICRLAAKSIYHAHQAQSYDVLKSTLTIIVHKVNVQFLPPHPNPP